MVGLPSPLVQYECESEGSSLCPWEKWQIISSGPGLNGSHTLSRPTFPFQFSAQQSWCMWRITWQDHSPPRPAPASCYSPARVPLWPCVSVCVCVCVCVCVFVCVMGGRRWAFLPREMALHPVYTAYLPVNLQRPRRTQTAYGGWPVRPRQPMPDTRAWMHIHTLAHTAWQKTSLSGRMLCCTKAYKQAINDSHALAGH